MMVKWGAVNAINLDGGGSASMVEWGVFSSLQLNPPSDCLIGEFVGTPSDHCAKKPSPLYRFRHAAARHAVQASLSGVGRCPRAVSTVICIHNDSTTCPGNCSYPQVSTSHKHQALTQLWTGSLPARRALWMQAQFHRRWMRATTVQVPLSCCLG